MSLEIKSIRFYNFRNYPSLFLDNFERLNIFCGENAIGKTNIIEGIQLLTALTSFRHPLLSQLVYSGQDEARIEMEVFDEKRNLEVACVLASGKKKYSVNGKTKQTADIKGIIPAVIFTPDDLNLVKGASSLRRDAIDNLGSQLSKNYYIVRKDYEQVIRYKNRLYKDEAAESLIDSINENLLTCGSQLIYYRVALVQKLFPLISQYYEQVAPQCEKLNIQYSPSWLEKEDELIHNNQKSLFSLKRADIKEYLVSELVVRKGEERARKRAVVGPHSDHVDFFINKKPAAAFGSQGQQRLCALSFKMAEVSVIEEIIHQKPVLLLDDVMSELDENRRRALMEFITTEVQTFITTTNLSYFTSEELERARVIKLPLKDSVL